MSDSSENISKTKKKDRAETLWDLEMENENEERIQRDDHDSSADSEASGQVEDVNRKRRQLPELSMLSNQNLLAQISSTGVLLQSLDKTPSTLDFVFVLNVRESELYPPLVLRSDFKCLEEKLSTYQSEFNSGNLRFYSGNMFCLNIRLTVCFYTFLMNFYRIFQSMPKPILSWPKIRY